MSSELVVVVGSACRFPGGVDRPSKLWELLIKPKDVGSEVPKDRFNIDSFYHPDGSYPGRSNARHGYFITTDTRSFDAPFFGIQASEAESLDPQQRLILETTYEALCSAGIPMQKLKGSPTAMYLGIMTHDYELIRASDTNHTPTYGVTGGAASIASNRVSYFFDWHGPSMTIDTACSSSMVAVHQAVQQLRSGESKVAIAAGTNLILSPLGYITESKLKMLSPTGRSRMWDASADGYARGEGVAALVLKTLSQALRDGDSIECVIRETGVNQDGRTPGITMPSAKAQEALIRQTYQKAGLDPVADRCQYFEAHGTGTPAGDPQEAEAIASAFFGGAAAGGDGQEKGKLIVGSIKTVIGHTEGTAGIAGLLKASMAVQHGVIPPNMFFETLSPRVAPFYDNLRIVTEPVEWPATPIGQPRRASVNSFGFGGTNAHAIIEQYLPASHAPQNGQNGVNGLKGRDEKNGQNSSSTPPSAPACALPLVLSASSERSLRTSMERLHQLLQDAPPSLSMIDLAWTLLRKQSALAVRQAIKGSSRDAACFELQRLLQAPELNAVTTRPGRGSQGTQQLPPRLLGIFTGQGAQWPGMLKSLIETLPFVRGAVQDLDASLQSLPEKYRPSWTLMGETLRDAKTSRVYESAISLPLCLAVQIVLCQLLAAAGVTFDAVVGHSGGEVAAAYVAGHITASQAVRIAHLRIEVARHVSGTTSTTTTTTTTLTPSSSLAEGAMLAAGVSHDDAREICELPVFEGKVCVGAYNAPESVTFSGDAEAVDRLEALLKDESKFARRLKVDRAYHSHHMLPFAAAYVDALEECGCGSPGVTNGSAESSPVPVWYSSAHLGKQMKLGDADANYWRDNLVQPVLFAQALDAALAGSGRPDAVVEVGPHPALKSPVTSNIATKDYAEEPPYVGCMQRGGNNLEDLAACLGFLWERFDLSAIDPDKFLNTVYDSVTPKDVSKSLPMYPWDHSRLFWSESRYIRASLHGPRPHLLLGHPSHNNTSSTWQWRNLFRLKDHEWMHGHTLQGQTIFPAAGYIVLALEAAMHVAHKRPVQLIELLDVDVDKAITFEDENTLAEVVTLAETEAVGGGDASSAPGDDQGLLLRLKIDSCFGRETKPSTSFSCKVRISFGAHQPEILGAARLEPPHAKDIDIESFYRSIKSLGYDYEGNYRRMISLKRADDRCTGTVQNLVLKDGNDHVMIAHPATMDPVFQSIMGAYSFPGDQRLRSLYVPVHIDRIAVVPGNCYEAAAGSLDEVGFHTAMVHDKGDILSCDTQVVDPANGRVLYQVDNLSSRPLVHPSPSTAHQIFLEWVWGPLNADPVIGSADNWISQKERDSIPVIERVTFYYIRKVLGQITDDDRRNASAPHTRLIMWCEHVLEEAQAGREKWYQAEWAKDTEEEILKLCEENWDHLQVRMIKRVSENMVATIRENSNPFYWMNKDGALSEFYQSSLAFGPALSQTRHLFGQLAHRYPNMDILEIGAGTGGTTKFIMSTPGFGFNSYTYTDISISFFEQARKDFASWEDQMEFRTLDIRLDPVEQGFTPGSYDIVFASNVLHATPSLHETFRNVRTLLKPGGRVIVLDLAGDSCVRYGFTFGLFADWWAGVEDGRPWHPWPTLERWDQVLQETGFKGIDIRTIDDHADIYPAMLFSGLALDDTVKKLEDPRSVEDHQQDREIVIVGGKTARVAEVAERIRRVLPHRRFRSIEALTDITPNKNNNNNNGAATLEEKSTCVVLSDLEDELFTGLDEAKFEAVKTLLGSVAHVLWLTESAWVRNPAQAGTIGLLRSAKMEYPSLELQMIDFDEQDAIDVDFIVEQLLRLELAPSVPDTTLWTKESEICWVKGRPLIPRLKRDAARNNRLISAMCPIQEPARASEVPVALRTKSLGGVKQYSLEKAETFPAPNLDSVEAAQAQATLTTTIQVHHSTLKALRIGRIGYCHLVVGTVQGSTGDVVVALSDTNASIVHVPSSQALPLRDVAPENLVEALLKAVSTVMAHSMLSDLPAEAALLMLDPPQFCIDEIVRQAEARHVKALVATSSSSKDSVKPGSLARNIISLNPHATERELARILPANVWALHDFSAGPDHATSTLSRRLLECLPQAAYKYDSSYTLRDEASPLLIGTDDTSSVLQMMRSAAETCNKGDKADDAVLVSARHVCTLSSASSSSSSSYSTILDWTADDELPAQVRAIDSDKLFAHNKTYLLVGLGGDLGRSLARWMVTRGAKHVVLLSRHPETPSALWNREVEAAGGSVTTLAMDVTSEQSVDAGLATIAKTLPPIAGIAFGPLVLSDALLRDMSFPMMDSVLRPRVFASQLFHERFSDPAKPLDFFVFFSSVAATTGNPGQCNYTTSNLHVQALMQKRQVAGLAGSTINIGAVFGVGLIHRSGREADFSQSQYQTDTLSEQELHTLFAEAVVAGRRFKTPAAGLDVVSAAALEVTTGIVLLDPTKQDMIKIWHDPRTAALKLPQRRSQKSGGADSGSAGSMREQLLHATSAREAGDIVVKGLSRKLRSTLQIAEDDKFDPTVPLVDQGVDSLGAVTVTQWFSKELLIDIPVLRILGGASVSTLAEEAVGRLSKDAIPLVQDAENGQTPAAAKEDANGTALPAPAKPANGIDMSGDLNEDVPEEPSTEAAVVVRRELLSLNQAHAWDIQNQNPDKPALLNSTIGMYLSGPIHMGRFSRAWNTALQRHEIFRTAFVKDEQSDKTVQVIFSRPKAYLQVKQVANKEAALAGYEAMKHQVYDLGSGDVVKLVLFRWDKESSLLVYGYHRLIGDGSTTENLFAEAGRLYAGSALPAPALQYADYAVRQRADLEGGRMQDDALYWTSLFADSRPILPVLQLPRAKPANAEAATAWVQHTASIRIKPMIARRVRDVSRQFKATAMHFYLATFHALLARASPLGTDASATGDIGIGLADTNRSAGADEPGAMGFFANTLPLRVAGYEPDRPFADEVAAVKSAVTKAMLHSRLAYPALLNLLGVRAEGSGRRRHEVMPLFQTLFDYRQGSTETGTIGEARIVETLVSREAMPYDVMLEVSDDPNKNPLLTLKLQASLYEPSDAEVLLNAYVGAVSAFVLNPAMRLSDLNVNFK